MGSRGGSQGGVRLRTHRAGGQTPPPTWGAGRATPGGRVAGCSRAESVHEAPQKAKRTPIARSSHLYRTLAAASHAGPQRAPALAHAAPAGLSRLPQCLLAPWAATAVCPRPNAPELDLGAPARPHPPAPAPSPQPQPSAAPPGPWRSRLRPAGSPFKMPPPRPPPAAPGRPAVPARSTLRPGAPGRCIAVPTALQGTCSLRLLAMRRWRCPGDGLRPPRPRFLPGPPEGWPARGPRV